MSHALLSLPLRTEADVVLVRQRARQVAALLGFGVQDQTRIATATSEIARNAVQYGGGGVVEYRVAAEPTGQWLRIRVADQGPGIAEVHAVLDGEHRSGTGLGVGIVGARRIVDELRIDSAPGAGTRVVLGKRLPEGVQLDERALAKLATELVRHRPRDLLEETQAQNRELLRTLDELRERQEELLQLNRELEDTNRGVVALYSELDERVDQLRRSSALRAQLTSYMSHEFRTPLDSIIALAGLLLNRVDGELTSEQEKQVTLLRGSAQDLLSLVDDLLDTASVEAGQLQVRPTRFALASLFSALRATLRPLLTSRSVALTIEEPAGLPLMETDEAKVSQILRNLVSNALKFTLRGEIRVEASAVDGGERIRISVTDTGVGIAPEDQAWIFEDFTRAEGAVQRRIKGTGLGLALSRKLARLLGGDVTVRSEPGRGSTFTVDLPRVYETSSDA